MSAPTNDGKNHNLFWSKPTEEEIALKKLELLRDITKNEADREQGKAQQRTGKSNELVDTAPRELIMRGLDESEMWATDWLWTGWVPRGYITIWVGETGAGKSTVLAISLQE